MRALHYSLLEALVGLRRAGRSTLLSIGTVAVAFLMLGVFLLIASNVQQMVDAWATAAEMSIFLRDDIDEGTRSTIAAELTAHGAVSQLEYVSKDQALARFKTEFPELTDVADSDGLNPFPASFELRLRSDAASVGAADVLAEQLMGRGGVADVRYDRQWLGRVRALVSGLRWTGLALAGVLVLGAAFTVAAVVRLSLFARRDEIEIMRLVGAPFAYLRGPSVVEGTIIGGVGALVSVLLLLAIYQTFKLRLTEAVVALAGDGHVLFLSVSDAALMMLAALALGGLTGVVVARGVR